MILIYKKIEGDIYVLYSSLNRVGDAVLCRSGLSYGKNKARSRIGHFQLCKIAYVRLPACVDNLLFLAGRFFFRSSLADALCIRFRTRTFGGGDTPLSFRDIPQKSAGR